MKRDLAAIREIIERWKKQKNVPEWEANDALEKLEYLLSVAD